MSAKLVIELSEKATEKYLSLAREKTEAEVDGNCEPSGVSLHFDLHPIFGGDAYFISGNKLLPLGDADFKLVSLFEAKTSK